MKSLAPFAFALALAAGTAAAESVPFQLATEARSPAHPALYSFADVYRLTVSGAALADFPLQDTLVRVAVSSQSAAPDNQFSINSVPEPERWLLLLSGIALAAWVARRRLGYAT